MNANFYLLAKHANEIAREKGFWTRESSSSPTATKVALIHTEIVELHEAADALDFPAILEEAADVVIRTLDLAIALDLNLDNYRIMTAVPEVNADGGGYYMLQMHRSAAGITQADRTDAVYGRSDAIVNLILGVRGYLFSLDFDDADLETAINAKMAKNAERPVLHGRRY